MIRRLSGHAATILSGDVGARFLGFLANVQIARALGADAFGLVVVALAALHYAIWLADLGMATIGTREIAKPEGERRFQSGDILLFKTGLAAVVFLGGQALLFLLPLPPELAMLIRLYLFFLFVEAVLLEWYFKGRREYAPFTASKWLGGLIYLAGATFLVGAPGDLFRVPLIYLAAHGAAALLLLALHRRREPFRAAPLSRRGLTGMIRRGLPVGLGSMFAQVVQLFPPMALAYFQSTAEAGRFGVAIRIVTVALVLDRIFVALYLPVMTRLWQSGAAAARERLEPALAYIIYGGTGAALGLSLFATPVVVLLFGESYRGAGPGLAVLSWFVVPTLVNSVFCFGLIAIEREGRYFHALWKGSAVAALIIAGFCAAGGLATAALGVVLAETVIAAFTWMAFRRDVALRFGRALLRAAGAALVAGFAWPYFAAEAPLWLLPVPVAAFFVMIAASGGLTRHQFTQLFRS